MDCNKYEISTLKLFRCDLTRHI